MSAFSSEAGGRGLVVAAAPTAAGAVVEMLRRIGYDTQFTSEPSEWHHKLTGFDLILLVNSKHSWFSQRIFEICSAVRRNAQEVPIIVVGPDDLEAKVSLFKAGADDYIVEPFDHREAVARVKSLIRRRRFGFL